MLAQLQRLLLRYNELIGSIPDAIGRLTRLEYLNLGNKRLSESIPESIGLLAQSQIVVLDFNELTGSIPGAIGNLTRLEILFLGYNKLTGLIPSSVGQLEQPARSPSPFLAKSAYQAVFQFQ